MKVISVLTSQFGGSGYGSVNVPNVEDYAIDSAMDTDADQFSIDIGDVDRSLSAVFKRDSEVRVSLKASFDDINYVHLVSGFADSISRTHDGTLSITGRDLSAAAIDDTAVPFNWRNMRPAKVIMDHARVRGFSRFGGILTRRGDTIKPFRNFYTDGSESEWAMWYRMVRERQMWIWCGSDGTLYVDRLNYGNAPRYLFGLPNQQYSNPDQWIRVMEFQEQKTTQNRIYEVWVFGDTGRVSFPPVKVTDPKIAEWIKKPLSITSAQAGITNRNQALKEAYEQLFEGMVGEIEILIRVSDPGFLIQQNSVALLNLPTEGISGEFFVVGTRILGGADGYIQEVRLREKVYALTRRIPQDPILKDTSVNESAQALGAALGLTKHLGEYFVLAAQAWHGGWDFNLFLATLLAICNQESTFRNLREGGAIEWTPPPGSGGVSSSDAKHHGESPSNVSSLAKWHKDFANDKGNPLNPFFPQREAGVGYMQLTDASAKKKADMRFGVSDEYVGGRWDAASNIWVAAEVLAEKLNDTKLPQTTQNFWVGVQGYNGYPTGVIEVGAYAKKIESSVKVTYLPQVTTALKDAPLLPANSTKTLKGLTAITPEAIRKVINFAERQIGKPYKWGAIGPDSYDCSGLVYAAYKAGGLSADIGGRQTTWGYWGNHGLKPKPVANLQYVTVDDLAVGDMIFFDIFTEGDPPGHMGIYYGDNQMIVAPSTGELVQIQSCSAPGYWTNLGGKRVKGIWPAAIPSGHHPGPN